MHWFFQYTKQKDKRKKIGKLFFSKLELRNTYKPCFRVPGSSPPPPQKVDFMLIHTLFLCNLIIKCIHSNFYAEILYKIAQALEYINIVIIYLFMVLGPCFISHKFFLSFCLTNGIEIHLLFNARDKINTK